MVEIKVRATTTALPAAVWALLADAEAWARWAAFDESVLERPATGPDRNGVGAIRRFKRRFATSREEVVAFEPPRHLGYVLLSGLPITGYRADVTMSPSAGGGTEITWHSTFRPKVAGTGRMIGFGLRRFIRDLVADLVNEAEAATAAPPARQVTAPT